MATFSGKSMEFKGVRVREVQIELHGGLSW
jgi:hypothetical protein